MLLHHRGRLVGSFRIIAATAAATLLTTTLTNTYTTSAMMMKSEEIDEDYPGTAVKRLKSVHARIKSLEKDDLNGEWEDVRRKLLWAGGLKDLRDVRPGMGYTGHAFNDWNHCDLTTMKGEEANNENENKVKGIHYSNQLGPGIRIASIPELGPGGSWSTCMMGCSSEPPIDVAHAQFRSRIAFKLVWIPPEFKSFVLLDDSGKRLAIGSPTGRLPHLRERQKNFAATGSGRYSKEPLKLSRGEL